MFEDDSEGINTKTCWGRKCFLGNGNSSGILSGPIMENQCQPKLIIEKPITNGLFFESKYYFEMTLFNNITKVEIVALTPLDYGLTIEVCIKGKYIEFFYSNDDETQMCYRPDITAHPENIEKDFVFIDVDVLDMFKEYYETMVENDIDFVDEEYMKNI